MSAGRKHSNLFLNKLIRMYIRITPHTFTCIFLSWDIISVVTHVVTFSVCSLYLKHLPRMRTSALPSRQLYTNSVRIIYSASLKALSKTLPELFSPKLFHHCFSKTSSKTRSTLTLNIAWKTVPTLLSWPFPYFPKVILWLSSDQTTPKTSSLSSLDLSWPF